MYAPSRLEKNEQCVSVTAQSPATTHEAARNGKDGRLESTPCTIIFIQKNTERAQLATVRRTRQAGVGIQERSDVSRLSLGLRRSLPITQADYLFSFDEYPVESGLRSEVAAWAE